MKAKNALGIEENLAHAALDVEEGTVQLCVCICVYGINS
jgi:hypothetical protein